jgi:hypothetical protein
MLDEMLVQEAKDNGHVVNWPQATIPLEEVLRLLSQLEGAGMLKNSLTPPGEWILWSEVPTGDLVSALHEHLSKTGWQRILEALHWHNRQTDESLWDLSRTEDFVSAVELALARWEEATGDEPSVTEDWVPALQRQVKDLMQAQLRPASVYAWLLSPRALVGRLSARARRARTETQIENAVSEAALHAARMVGTDTERDVALTRVEQLREQLDGHLQVFCEEQGLPLPRPYSREEAYCLHLLNAYFVALAEAEDAIARRGASLARRQISLEGEQANARMDRQLLPGLLDAQREVNPLRESLFRERTRHKLSLLIGGLLGAVGGGLWGAVESVSDVLIAGVARYAAVVAPALLVGLLTLMAQTVAYSGPFTPGVVAQFIVRALWNGSLALGGTILVYGCWLYYVDQREGHRPESGEPQH